MLQDLLSQPAVQGKADTELVRLKQYQLLQKKVGDRQQFTSSNEEFLRQCEITVDVRRDCQLAFDRLLEMIQRTNQLNYTKQHLAADQLRTLIDDPAVDCGYVKVQDRYGDYGIAGFYAKHRPARALLFSCRILNMGVDRWVYNRLGRPQLTIVGDVSDDPTLLPVPDWIQASDSATARQQELPATNGKFPHVLLKGSCDLGQVVDFLGAPTPSSASSIM